jgi:predicted NACHT family NTPase
VVLKAIEHHHGLLVERARNIYSFSHLTFQEYFAAKAIERGQQLEILVENISNPRWKEVFYLTAEMLWRSDDFLKLMKDRIDGMLAGDENLQAFLEWANRKANSVKFSYKTVAVKAFYTYIEALDLTSARALAHAHALNFSNDLALDLDLDRALAHTLVLVINQGRGRDLSRALDLDLGRALALDRAIDLDLARARALDLARARARARDEALELVAAIGLECLVELQSPGCRWLFLCDAVAPSFSK